MQQQLAVVFIQSVFFLNFMCIISAASTRITVNPQEATFDCEDETFENSSIICNSLDSAIAYIIMDLEVQNLFNETDMNSASSSVAITLPNGVHYITTQTNFGDANVNFVGLGHNVTVVCEYYADNGTFDSARIHTWFFNKSRSVGMENIHFRNCGFPFRFTFIQQINISNCTYMKFREAVLDIYNCQNVRLNHIILQDNAGNGRLLESVRGNSGAVAIGYNALPVEFISPTLTVLNSRFSRNRALGFLSPERAVTGQVFLGRGGGLALYMNESVQDINVEIADCVFEHNMARLFGGGLFILTTSYVTVQHTVHVRRSQFFHNVGLSGGAGIQLSFLSSGDINRPHSFTFSDCTFNGNRGQSGGGIYIFIGNNGNWARLERCHFANNSGFGTQNDLGAAIAFSYLVRFSQRVTSIRQEITNW